MEVVNDKYWLDYAKQTIQQSSENWSSAAKKLQEMTAWFWTAYTSLFIAGVITKTISVPLCTSVLLFAPIVLLIPTYWYCTIAQIPISGSFDPRIPSEIRETYNYGIQKKEQRFKVALGFTLVTALSISIGILSIIFQNNYYLSVRFNHDKDVLLLSGEIPHDKLLLVTVDSLTVAKAKIPIYRKELFIQKDKDFYLDIPIKSKNSELIVSVIWDESNVRQGILKYVQP